jgi:DNA adenine methylase
MYMPQPIPYQGSKRLLAKSILAYFPHSINNLYEPFAGSAAVTIAAAYKNKAKHYFINDLNAPLMSLLDMIINHPFELSNLYEILWNEQLGREKEFYNSVRLEFNKSHQPHHFLYLLARGVKGAIRYNSNGEFNQSPDNRRRGKIPSTMKKEIIFISRILREKTTITALDFRKATENAAINDILYLDPPYQGVCTNRDSRYLSGISYDELVIYLEKINHLDIPFILSYDGKTGDKIHGKNLPLELGAIKIEIDAGRSTTSTLNGGTDRTIESLYLSKVLVKRLGISPLEITSFIKSHQLTPQTIF